MEKRTPGNTMPALHCLYLERDTGTEKSVMTMMSIAGWTVGSKVWLGSIHKSRKRGN
jgi:hypothetical protein